MKVKVYAVRDLKVGAFMAPFFCVAHGQAVRTFQDTVADPGMVLSKHPEDFDLFYLADFDDNTGLIVSVDSPVHLSTAVEFVRKDDGRTSDLRLLPPAGGSGN